jgi:AcrR family transcriptional regulator
MSASRTRGRPREFDTAKALRGAMELFWEKGYDASTLPELLAAMGNLSPPSFYAAFGSKEQVFADAVALYRKEIGCEAATALDGGATARESIAAFFRASLKMITSSKPARGCLMVLGAVNSTNPSATALLRETRCEGQDLIRKRIRRGIAEGDVPKSADADAIAAFYATVGYGLAHGAKDGTPPSTLARVVDAAIGAWDTVVGTRSARTRKTRRRA